MYKGGWKVQPCVWFFSLLYASFFSLLYGMPAPSAERQHPEAWPASTFERVPAAYSLFAGTVPAFNLFLNIIRLLYGYVLINHNLYLKYCGSVFKEIT